MAMMFRGAGKPSITGYNPLPGPISGYGGGTFSMDGRQITPTYPDTPDTAAPADTTGKPNWAGIAADFLSGMAGQGPVFAPIQAREKARSQALQDAETQRQRDVADWLAKEQWKLQNKGPSEDSFTRALEAAGIQRGTPEYVAMARKRAEMLTNPVQLVSDGMGGTVAVRPNSVGGGLPPGYDPEEWEVVEGDGGGNATGGFRP